ncbi:hypothetical protein GH714_034921 [Hevea brasiliensis]|uniref:NAC domain-containing protein n=1 Tax=Hevea brasiliensis TaxID=3981 RepID=A0A6A6L8D8_HEVBR|nr:hypothetical protein GH714_034921 [Hevea brasiliensis]
MEVTQPQSNASVTATRQPRTDPINDNNRKNFIDIDYFNSFPPGYRFRPLDGELVVHYLKNKIANQPLPPNKIMEVKLYEYNPENLQTEWYFFTPRDKRYPNGSRPKRDAGGGYWKATGGDKAVKYKGAVVGYRKALVFYMGKPPNGTKTNWIMHEYRVSDAPPRIKTSADDMRLDNVVLCKIYKRDAKDNLRSRLSNEEQSAELDDQTADVVRDVDKNSDPAAYTNALNDNKQIVSIPIQENPSAFYEDPPYVPINDHDHHQAMLEAANYQRAMFAAANYGSYRTYATGMTPPMPEPVQIYPPEDIQIHPTEDIQIHPTEDIQIQPTEDIVSKYLNENSYICSSMDLGTEDRQYQAHIRGLNAYDRHKKFLNDYGKEKSSNVKLPVKTDRDTLREGYRFIRTEEDDMDTSWEQRLVKRYYDKLFNEYP